MPTNHQTYVVAHSQNAGTDTPCGPLVPWACYGSHRFVSVADAADAMRHEIGSAAVVSVATARARARALAYLGQRQYPRWR